MKKVRHKELLYKVPKVMSRNCGKGSNLGLQTLLISLHHFALFISKFCTHAWVSHIRSLCLGFLIGGIMSTGWALQWWFCHSLLTL